MTHQHRTLTSPIQFFCRTLLLACLSLFVSCSFQRLQPVSTNPPPVHTKQFATELATVGKAPWTQGNHIEALHNGDEFFPVMLEAVKNAQHSITFESFVSRRSWPVYQFSEAFYEAAQRGVKVHLILDSFGSRHWGDTYLADMRKTGIEIEWYSPFTLLRPMRYNHRTHRRVLVVDGKIGYTGGAGWTDRWSGHAQSPDNWRDVQLELRGPVVAQLQDNFNDNWEELTGTQLEGPRYFPPQKAQGNLTAQMILGSPEKQEDTIGSTNLLAIRSAKKSIYLAHSYFLPNKIITKALYDALDRGVHIEIIVPGKHTDMPIARLVTIGALRKLHQKGAHIYEYQPTMMHAKLLVIDEHLTIAGSGNIDQRSFFINDENNLHVLDSSFAKKQIATFRTDRKHCTLLTDKDLRLKISQLPAAGVGKIFESQL